MTEVLYDAFISYRITARDRARTAQATLESLGRRHDPDRPFRVFLDTSSLLPGDLLLEINSALERSHTLIVMIARDTLESVWVNREISYWLAHGGSTERLILVRLDDVDLTWDRDQKEFARPEGLPHSLRSLFTGEQKWIDFPVIQQERREPFRLAPVYARIRGIPTESLLLHEATLERQRRRRITVVAALMGLLLFIAVGGAFWALTSQRAAEEAAVVARAEADAAQSILAGETSAVRAAQLAIRAANAVDSPSVRAAMLNAADRASHLLHSIDTDTLVGDGLSLWRKLLAVWGQGQSGSEIRLYDIETGRVVATGPTAGAVESVEMLSARFGVACQDARPYIVRVSASDVTVDPLDSRLTAPPADTSEHSQMEYCSVTRAGDGAIVGYSVAVGEDGWLIGTDWVSEAGSRHLSDDVGLLEAEAGESMVLTFKGGTETRIFDIDSDKTFLLDKVNVGGVRDVDDQGNLLVKLSEGEDSPGWAFVLRTGDEYLVSAIDAPDDAADVAATVEAAPGGAGVSFNGELVWITKAGAVRATQEPTGVNFAVPPTYDADLDFKPRVVRLDESTYLATFAQSAAVINLTPGAEATGDWRTASNGWTFVSVDHALAEPNGALRDPIVDTCGDTAILEGAGDGGQVVVSADGYSRATESWTLFFRSDCALVQSSPDAWRTADATGDVVVRQARSSGFTAANQTHLARMIADQPIEIYMRKEQSQAWQWHPDSHRTYLQGNPGDGFIIEDGGVIFLQDGKQSDLVPADVEEARFAQAPDSSSIVLYSANWTDLPAQYVTSAGARAAPACDAAMSVHFVPSPGFEESRDAAERYAAVGVLQGKDDLSSTELVDCVSGQPWKGVDPSQVTNYVIDEAGGYVTLREPARGYVHIAWSPEHGPQVHQIQPEPWTNLPLLDAPIAYQPVWSRDGNWIAYAGAGPGSGTGTALHRSEEGWEKPVELGSQVFMLQDVAFLDDDGLMLAMGYSGEFEIIDGSTLRALARGTIPANAISAIAVSTESGVATVRVQTNDLPYAQADGSLVIRTSTQQLRDTLCAIHRVPECEINRE